MTELAAGLLRSWLTRLVEPRPAQQDPLRQCTQIPRLGGGSGLTLAVWRKHRGTQEGTRSGRRSATASPDHCATCGYRSPTAATSAAATACRATSSAPTTRSCRATSCCPTKSSLGWYG